MSKLEKNDLIDWFVSGEKPREDWKIGTEHEKFVVLDSVAQEVPMPSLYNTQSLMALHGEG